MSTRSALAWPKPTTGVSYGVAILTVVAVVAAAELFAGLLDTNPLVSLFLCGIMFVAWYGGAGPGCFAAAMSVLAFVYFFVSPTYSFAFAIKDLPRVALFAM